MDILSYRGPGSAGGVSSAISTVFSRYGEHHSWWHIENSALVRRAIGQNRARQSVANISDSIVLGHYRYCNNFLWPILHNLPQHATYIRDERRAYQQFNLAVGHNFLRASNDSGKRRIFVNDYQFSLLSSLLYSDCNPEISLFWHIPWPNRIQDQYLPQLVEIARGLLSARRIGFHLDQYALNFMEFVEKNIPEASVDFERNVIEEDLDISVRPITTEIVVHPLGLQSSIWSNENDLSMADGELSSIMSKKYVLSVDRADYTKGVLERIAAIDEFFERYPSYLSKITFVQLCQRTRPGLEAFDRYWQTCLDRASEVNRRWGTDDWEPISWISFPVSSAVLSHLYRGASAMLINPIRDGLNLTAKEFVISNGTNEYEPGALLLSPGAGVFQELGEYTLLVDPHDSTQMAEQIFRALNMAIEDKRRRLDTMKRIVHDNPLESWWHRFGMPCTVSQQTNGELIAGSQKALSQPA